MTNILKPHQLSLFKTYPTYDKFMKDLAPDKLIAAFAGIEYIEQSISKKRISLEDIDSIYKISGGSAGVDYLELWINYIAAFSNLKPLPEAKAVAYMIFTRFKALYLVDLKLLFDRIIRAEYGKESLFFGCIDAQRLLYCFNQYNLDRTRIGNKYLQKLQESFIKIKEDIEEKEKARIHEELKDIYEAGKLWDVYLKRCHDEIPPIIQAAWEKYIQNQPNEVEKQ